MCTPLQNLEVNVCDVQPIYQLQCIIEHVGTGIRSGHYVSYFKTNDMWYRASDEDVSRISTENLPKQPYISIYKQTDAAPPSRPLSPPAPPSPEETDCEGTTNTTNADKSNDARQPASQLISLCINFLMSSSEFKTFVNTNNLRRKLLQIGKDNAH